MARRRSRLRDLAGPSEEELAAARTAGSATQTGAGIGGAIGTGVGTLAGLAPLLIPGAGVPVAALTAPAGAAVGGALGSALGGHIGGTFADDAESKLREGELERMEQIEDEQLRQEALDRFLRTR